MNAIPPVLDVDSLATLLRENPRVRLIDVRTPGEYESIHIRGAYNVPLDTLGEHSREIRAHVEDPVVLVCRSGARARQAEQALRGAGMPNLHVLDGGVTGWQGAGQPVEEGRERISLERQVRIAAGALTAIGGILALLVNPLFVLVPVMVGSGLVFAGVTDNCAMAMVLVRLPYNRSASCDVDAMVRALKEGTTPSELTRGGAGARAAG
jgi:rhodanese-related sulfurtransferase